ncbi:MAG: glycosyltransferase family 1 protein [Bacteroidales bacterium]|nr:glycosyltransferase family 1 protein [Bacteroidales bacterium]
MKILFAGDASNMHHCLAQQLRQMGHYAVVASGGSGWMNTGRDIDLRRYPGRIGAVRYVATLLANLHKMRGFDVVQLCGPIFFELKPWRLKHVLNFLKNHNGKIVLSALGTDYVYYNACHDGHTYRYSDYMVGNQPSPYVGSPEYFAQQQDNWKAPFMKDYSDFVLSTIDGAVACLWEYYAAYAPILGPKVIHAGIPIDVDALQPHFIDEEPEKVRFFIGIQRKRTVIKGTDRLMAALERVHAEMPDRCEIERVENLPYDEYVRRMNSSHVLLDQLYSYTPATNALLAMAQGMVAVSGAEPEYYDLIGETTNHPIINVSPTPEGHIEQQLRWLIENKAMLPTLSHNSRTFVETHNAANKVAKRYLDFWETL